MFFDILLQPPALGRKIEMQRIKYQDLLYIFDVFTLTWIVNVPRAQKNRLLAVLSNRKIADQLESLINMV